MSRRLGANQTRMQLFALAYNLVNFLWRPAVPKNAPIRRAPAPWIRIPSPTKRRQRIAESASH